jgi:hypothetical protein
MKCVSKWFFFLATWITVTAASTCLWFTFLCYLNRFSQVLDVCEAQKVVLCKTRNKVACSCIFIDKRCLTCFTTTCYNPNRSVRWQRQREQQQHYLSTIVLIVWPIFESTYSCWLWRALNSLNPEFSARHSQHGYFHAVPLPTVSFSTDYELGFCAFCNCLDRLVDMSILMQSEDYEDYCTSWSWDALHVSRITSRWSTT